jgi:hypothetical protein
VVDHQVDDHADAPVVGLVQQFGEVAEAAEPRVDGVVVGDVVAAVATRRRVDRVEPQAGDAEPVEVVEPADQAPEVTAAVLGGVRVRLDVDAVDDSLLVPMLLAHLIDSLVVRATTAAGR